MSGTNLGTITFTLLVNSPSLTATSQKIKKFEKEATDSLSAVDRIARNLRNTFGLLFGGETARQALLMADSYARMGDRIKSIIGNADQATRVLKVLTEVSKQSGMAIEATAGGFQQMYAARNTVKGTTVEMIKLTNAFMQLGMISGTAPHLLEKAMVQFSQGLVTGRFQAQEMQSVLEAVPAITQHIADGMGISVAKLIYLKQEGELVSKDIFQGLLKQTDLINEQAEKMPMRLGRAWGIFKINAQESLFQLDSMFGTSEKLSDSLVKVGGSIRKLPALLQASAGYMRQLTDNNPMFEEMVLNVGKAGIYFAVLAAAVKLTSSSFNILSGSMKFLSVSTGMSFFISAIALTVAFKDEIQALGDKLDDFYKKHVKTSSLFGKIKQGYNKVFGEGDNHSFFKTMEKDEKLQEEAQRKKEAAEKNIKKDGPKSTYDSLLESIAEAEKALKTTTVDDDIPEKSKEKKKEKEDTERIKKHGFWKIRHQDWVAENMRMSDSKENDNYIQSQEDMFKDNINMAAQHSKEFAAIQKGMAVFQLMLDTPKAVGSAYAFGTNVGGPAVGTAFGAVAAAAMGVQLAAVMSAPAPRAVGGSVFSNRNYQVSENGPEMYSSGGRNYLLTNASQGEIKPVSSNSSPVNVVINVNNTSDTKATVQRTQNGNDLEFNILIEKIENTLAGRVSRGDSILGRSLSNTYSLNRGVSAI